jgi:hypothetical protein
MGAGVAIVVCLVEVVALGTLEGSERSGHANDVFAGTAVWTGRNGQPRRRIHENPPG